jgi:PPOX class probable F420-dependent enzyme
LIKIKAVARSAINKARIARLATVATGNTAQLHLVPVVFVFDGQKFFIPLDQKRKTVSPERLRRTKNIETNPYVALLIDNYDEDWTKLFFVLVQGKATIIGKEHDGLLTKVHKMLFIKYPQYREVGVGKSCIAIYPDNVIFWKNW